MKTYNIGGIKIGFSYVCDDYFVNRIEKYLDVQESFDYKMVSLVEEGLIEPNLPCALMHANRKLFADGDKEILCIYEKDGMLSVKVSYTVDYRDITFSFNKALDKRLAETEYVITGLFFLEIMLREGFIGLHASAIRYQNDAILFSAPSGTGKSTHANLWEAHLDGVTFINDDKPLIKVEENSLTVIGSPWSGKTCRNDNVAIKLKAIVFLEQSKEDCVVELNTKDKVMHLLRNSYRTRDEAYYAMMLGHIQTLIQNVDIFLLRCTPDKSAVEKAFIQIYKKELTNEN